jgi:hypothetical protein
VIKDGGEKNVPIGTHTRYVLVPILPVAVHILLINIKGSQDITSDQTEREISKRLSRPQYKGCSLGLTNKKKVSRVCTYS